MSNLVPMKSGALIGQEEIKVLKDSLFKNFTDAEINYCVAICNQLNLSPLLKHVHFVKRTGSDGKSVIATQTGIDGLRLSAQRSGQYAGSDRAIFEYDGDNKIPSVAIVTVYRIIEGQRVPFTGEANWIEFYPSNPKNRRMWDQMPKNQLAKCAEAQALRKGFPAECSNMYIDEEMHQADNPNKAEGVQKKIMGKSDDIETTADEIDEVSEFDEQNEPEEAAPPKCSLCSTEMRVSKSGQSWYCPNFNDNKGVHPKIQI